MLGCLTLMLAPQQPVCASVCCTPSKQAGFRYHLVLPLHALNCADILL